MSRVLINKSGDKKLLDKCYVKQEPDFCNYEFCLFVNACPFAL